MHSEDLKTNHSKYRNIWNPDFFKVGNQMVKFFNGLDMFIFFSSLYITLI